RPEVLRDALHRHPHCLRNRSLHGMMPRRGLEEDQEPRRFTEVPQEVHAFTRKRLIESSELELYQVYLIRRYGGLEARYPDARRRGGNRLRRIRPPPYGARGGQRGCPDPLRHGRRELL